MLRSLGRAGVVPASLSSLITGEDSEKGWNLSKLANELPIDMLHVHNHLILRYTK